MKTKGTTYRPTLESVQAAATTLKGVAAVTPLMKSITYSNKHNANIILKREDLQEVRSYKIRGAYNKIANLCPSKLSNGVVCASAGNHAQGVAYSCEKLGVFGTIFIPETTPLQKIERIIWFGGKHIELILFGNTFDDANKKAMKYAKRKNKAFIPPFDDKKIIEVLHPTPATLGFPKNEAYKFLSTYEGYNRGYYAGSFGWIDKKKTIIKVAIRSGYINN
ncbi:MAG TPA: pyridoxal-phosphate dependent enzyme, partial [Bacteroidetes bacterium]|nr:pyridoxal-phosphate dependent enzyme [Bacteroidota bacterium]